MAKKYVSNKDESVRMFRSDFLEAFTRVHPAVPHLIYIPVIAVMLYWSIRLGLGVGQIALLVGLGALIWSLTEYVGHRFGFHAPPDVEDDVREALARLAPGEAALPAIKGWRHTLYFIAHGVHHDFPNDSRRLVMPPGVSVPLAIMFFFLFRWVFGVTYGPAAFAGLVLGYLVYDTVHYAVHHFRLHGRLTLFLKKHHFRHHYQNSTRDFGVSSPLWDLVFRSWNRQRERVQQPT